MHNEKTGDFLIELSNNCHSREMFSFLSGFLCHYALDSTAHPYINRLADHGTATHIAIERRLDVIELTRHNKELNGNLLLRGFFPPFPPESMRFDLEKVVLKVYGWEDFWDKYKTSYLHMKLFYRIAEDPKGYLAFITSRLYRLKNGNITSLSYQNQLCDGMEFLEFDELKEKAITEAVGFIEAACSYRNGTISEEELRRIIGNRKYSGKE